MAKLVIAGSSDCPYFAKIELLGDCLAKNVPNFKLHKIVKTPETWKEWMEEECKVRGWAHQTSPLVWRELVDRGGKGVYIGGSNEFQEYIRNYYNLKSLLTSDDMRKIGEENRVTKVELDEEEAAFKALSKPLRVAITNSSHPICYNLVNRIGCGEVFGMKEEVSLFLGADNSEVEFLEGMKMEMVDMAHPLLRGVAIEPNLHEAFTDCSVVLLLDDPQQGEEEERDVYIKRREEHFKHLGTLIQNSARRDVKVIVANDGPVNLDTLMVIKGAPKISRQNIVGLARVVENHAKAVIGERLKVNSSHIRNLVVWGNVNSDAFLDVSQARVHGYEGAIWGPPSFSLPVPEMVHDKQWLDTDFINLVRSRRQTVEAATGHRASMADAASIATLLQHWWHGSPHKEFYSLAVYSEGWYNFPEDLVISLPVTFDPKGYWHVVQDFELSPETKEKVDASIEVAIKEKEIIFPPPVPPKDSPSIACSTSQQKIEIEEKAAEEAVPSEADGEHRESIDVDEAAEGQKASNENAENEGENA